MLDKKIAVFIAVTLSALPGCSILDESIEYTPMVDKQKISDNSMLVSKRYSVINDYNELQFSNYEMRENQTTNSQYKILNSNLDRLVMELVRNFPDSSFNKSVIISAITFSNNAVGLDQQGLYVVERSLIAKFREFGFEVFEGRTPKGKLEGDELVVMSVVHQIGDQLELETSLKMLNSTKIEIIETTMLPKYFFKTMLDGIEFVPAPEPGDYVNEF